MAEVRAAAPVVADAHVQDTVTFGHLDVGGGGAGVLGRVGQCLADGVIRGDLDRVGQPPLNLDVEVNGDRGAAGQRLQRRAQAALGQDGRMQPPAPTVTVTARPSATPPASTAGLTNAEAVVTQFYQDITDGTYAAAWALGGDNVSSGVSYAN